MSQIVIRPGETEFDVQHRIQGALDLPLTERGRSQIQEIVKELRGREIEVIYTSPNEPAFSTAKTLGEVLDIPVQSVPGLGNVHLGLWQGMCVDEIRRKQPRVFKQWEEQPEAICPPEGESCEDVYHRVSRGLKKPMRRDEPFAVVASEPVATVILSVLRGTEPKFCGPDACEAGRPLVEIVDSEPHRADDLVAAPGPTSSLSPFLWWRSVPQQ